MKTQQEIKDRIVKLEKTIKKFKLEGGWQSSISSIQEEITTLKWILAPSELIEKVEMKKILIIHPEDSTTDFLKAIYEDLDATVVTERLSKSKLKVAINEHQRIILLGHGTEFGLAYDGQTYIDSRLVYLLREKDCVCIWCNADKFVNKYALTGFYTGMIISDWTEANLYCVNADDVQIELSNQMFATAVKESISLTSIEMKESVIEKYQSNNPVVEFNIENIYSV